MLQLKCGFQEILLWKVAFDMKMEQELHTGMLGRVRSRGSSPCRTPEAGESCSEMRRPTQKEEVDQMDSEVPEQAGWWES